MRISNEIEQKKTIEKWIKHRPKNNKKSIANQWKISQQISQNLPNIHQKSFLDGSLGGPEDSWGPRSKKHDLHPGSWRLMGRSWTRLGDLLTPSWPLDRRLGPSWAVLEPSWALLKSMQKSIKNLMPVKIGFYINFHRFLHRKWNQITTKMEWKIDLILDWVKKRKLL